MNKDALSKNWGLLIAGVGALVSLFTLLFLPFVMVTVDLGSSSLDYSSGVPNLLFVRLSMPQLAQQYILLWLTVPLALALALLALLPLVRRSLFIVTNGQLVVREGLQRSWAYFLLGGAALNMLILAGSCLQAAQEIQTTYLQFPGVENAIENYFQNLLSGALTALLGGQALLRHLALMAHASLSVTGGFYIAMLGMAAVIAGGLLMLTQGGEADVQHCAPPVHAPVVAPSAEALVPLGEHLSADFPHREV